MRSALARAAIRRGSSTMIFLPLTQGSSISASGTRVVLPAPGGATSTAALWLPSVRARSSRTASIGGGGSKERGKIHPPAPPPPPPGGGGGGGGGPPIREFWRLKCGDSPHPALRADLSPQE